jgi:hypothetical protein
LAKLQRLLTNNFLPMEQLGNFVLNIHLSVVARQLDLGKIWGALIDANGEVA